MKLLMGASSLPSTSGILILFCDSMKTHQIESCFVATLANSQKNISWSFAKIHHKSLFSQSPFGKNR